MVRHPARAESRSSSGLVWLFPTKRLLYVKGAVTAPLPTRNVPCPSRAEPDQLMDAFLFMPASHPDLWRPAPWSSARASARILQHRGDTLARSDADAENAGFSTAAAGLANSCVLFRRRTRIGGAAQSGNQVLQQPFGRTPIAVDCHATEARLTRARRGRQRVEVGHRPPYGGAGVCQQAVPRRQAAVPHPDVALLAVEDEVGRFQTRRW